MARKGSKKSSAASPADAAAVSTTTTATAVKKRGKKSPVVYRGSVILEGLPMDLRRIYDQSLRRFFPAAQQKQIKSTSVIREIDGATLCVEVDGKAMAQTMFRRLQNVRVYGRRWKLQYLPVSELECKSDACLVSCRLHPAASLSLAERALAGVPGFLSFVEARESGGGAGGDAAAGHASTTASFHGASSAYVDDSALPEERVYEVALASFADEGSALHARATLSGRLIGSSGVRMFIERRCGVV